MIPGKTREKKGKTPLSAFRLLRAVFPFRPRHFSEKPELVILSHIFTKKSSRLKNVNCWKTFRLPFLPSKKVFHIIHNRAFHALGKNKRRSSLHFMRSDQKLCRVCQQKNAGLSTCRIGKRKGKRWGLRGPSSAGLIIASPLQVDLRRLRLRIVATIDAVLGRTAPNYPNKIHGKNSAFLDKGAGSCYAFETEKAHRREKHESCNDPGGVPVNAFLV